MTLNKCGALWIWFGTNMVVDNKHFDWDKISKFYAHPVWLLNGLFIEQHEESMRHCHVISDWIVQSKFKNILDYRVGFGTLARLIAQKNKATTVNIYEPHPSEFGLKRKLEFNKINIISKLDQNYDCLVSADVLEHVPNPINDFVNIIKSVKTDGYLVIANCFHSVIKCHLPQIFHLKYTLNQFAKMLGLEVIGLLEDSHATIYKKVVDVNLFGKNKVI
ncbi:hypothetical protein A2G94_05335 [Francisella endosymbiont of Ornithodoros moubata]|uniref:methyltransferase domain-containing protein n=1 Tax=Francisella-like endosymbiont TaxID=512373 RepID=UPI000A25CEA4|nr:hypothetical protein A2G94_05335 [Francisella endosymbiont of Ornithodoros moubata]